MAIALVVTLKIQDGKQQEFEQVFRDLAAQVRSKEPGCMLYQLAKTNDPTTYKVLELYKDQDALTSHGQTEYFRAAGPKLGAVLGGAPAMEQLTTVD